MNTSSLRNTRENAINKKLTETIVATKNKSKPKTAIISYDYEAAISQPDISSTIDDNIQNASWSDSSDGLSAPTKKKNHYTRGKVNVTTKKKNIIFKSKTQTKKIMKINPQQICNVVEIKKESVPSSEIIQDTENFGKEMIDAVIESHETSLNFQQKNLVHSKDIQKPPEIAENNKNFINIVDHTSKETGNLYKKNSDKINEDAKLYTSQNKTSKIPRIKPNFFSPAYEEFHIYSNRKMPIKNKLNCSTNIKSSMEYSEEKKNFWYFEKSSEMDADEELEEDSSTTESPIITGDNLRSATLLKSLTLKCNCHTDQCTETESWTPLETESAKKWKKKSVKHHKLDTDSEDLDLMSDYNVINYRNFHSNEKDNRMSNCTDHVMKPSLAKPTKGQTYRTTSFFFFNVFFDIVFWPFVFLRTKQ